LVPFAQQKMFDLVNDVEQYPEFVPGCVGAQVLKRGDGWLEARLELSKAGFSHAFVTCNTLVEPERIHLKLVEGPFKHLEGEWDFQALSENACKVTFWLEFEFKSRLLAFAAARLFEHIASEQVDAMVLRARRLYAAPR
jgi:ribosome-associated toxin RatA of RatAB toxin-antitoxin module